MGESGDTHLYHLKEVRLLSEKYPTRDHYPFNIDVLQQTQGIKFSSPVTFFIGENGSGKTTLLEALQEGAVSTSGAELKEPVL